MSREPSSKTSRTSATRTSYTRTGHTRVGNTTRTQVTGESRGRWVALGLATLRLGRRIESVARRLWGVLEAVVTPAGWLAGIWAIVGIAVGLIWGWSEFLIGGVIAVVLLLIAVPFLLGKESYDVDFGLGHDAVVAGQAAEGEIVVRNQQARVALPGRIDIPVGAGLIDFHVPMLRKGHEHREKIVIPAARRGVIDVGPATTSRSDPLRLLTREFHWADVSTLFIHPVTIAIPSTSMGFVRDLEGRATKTITNEDISFHAVREYARGDAQRQIHWKSTAKTGTLMVRQFEETRRSTISIVLDLDAESYANETEFEMAVSAVGSLGVRALRDGRDVQAVVSGEVPEFARASVRSLQHLRVTTPRSFLDDLSGVEASSSVIGVQSVTRMLAESTSDTSLAFLVTGSTATLAQLQSAALAFPGDVAVAAVVCDPESEPSVHAVGRMRLLSLGVLDDLRQLLAKGAAV
ncbi:DUF58 domain-containing protein [Demequina oxidasica]|uniref:DUF58 domain-containing protein n=1 Tax=Demequina oxidasica TaxID=676199 RepID=UPI0007816338|nr:DUF58 domain-containing protein [Demequina oxidasica]